MSGYLSRLGVAAALMLVAALVAATGFGLICVAGYLALLTPLGPIGAALVLGGILLALALIILLVALLVPGRRPALLSFGAGDRPARAAGGGEFEGLLAQAAPWIRSHQYAASLAAVAAGLAVGASPALRQMLQDLLAAGLGGKSGPPPQI